jgi:hypothetical protein
VILPEVRDPRLVTIRRGGTLTDDDHLPDAVRDLVLEDQARRNLLCWNVFQV